MWQTKLKSFSVAAGVLCAMALAPSAVSAATMIGDTSFGIGGAFTLPAGKNLGNTNAVFVSGDVIVVAPDMFDLSALVTTGLHGTLKDINNISAFPGAGILAYLDLHNGVVVDLMTLSDNNRLFSPNFSFLNMSGDVIVHAPGFLATPGVLSFTGTSTDNRTFSLAITTSAHTVPVPEPASLALLGVGLLGLFAAARYRQRAPVAL